MISLISRIGRGDRRRELVEVLFNPGRGDQSVATGVNPWLKDESHRTPGEVTEAVDVS